LPSAADRRADLAGPEPGAAETVRDWVAFWDTKHSIYVNARHHQAHYQRIADDLRRYVPRGGAVLDYGCGEALAAEQIARPAGRLVLCEAAPALRTTLTQRFAGNGKIAVATPDQVAAMLPQSLDLIVMHSVAQYLTPEELDAQLAVFRRLLKPDGVLLLGDVIPTTVSAATDAMALLRFGASDGFFFAALFGLVRTALSNYRSLRSKLGLSRYDERAIMEKLQSAGFAAVRAADNVGHNPARMTFLARPR
jgi:SAM-dependent methyltransferase